MKTSSAGRLDQTDKARTFALQWVSSNVFNVPDLSDLAREIERLASLMTGDARLQGISGGDIARAVGDIDDYLTGEYGKRQPVQVVPAT